MSWPDRRALALLGVGLPIVQAPMAGAQGSGLAIAVAQAGGLASLPCAMLTAEQVRAEVATFRAHTSGPITNVFTGRPARGVVNGAMRELGPMSSEAPPFPLATGALLPLRARAEAAGSDDFTWMWSGQAARLARELPAGELTRLLAEQALARLG